MTPRPRRVRLELDRLELCALMMIVDHGVDRRRRSKLCRRDVSRARVVLARALLRACDCRSSAKTARPKARHHSSVDMR
jgi:hypothetical protein